MHNMNLMYVLINVDNGAIIKFPRLYYYIEQG